MSIPACPHGRQQTKPWGPSLCLFSILMTLFKSQSSFRAFELAFTLRPHNRYHTLSWTKKKCIPYTCDVSINTKTAITLQVRRRVIIFWGTQLRYKEIIVSPALIKPNVPTSGSNKSSGPQTQMLHSPVFLFLEHDNEHVWADGLVGPLEPVAVKGTDCGLIVTTDNTPLRSCVT
jgi:hypothetical protein